MPSPLFSDSTYTVGGLMHDIGRGEVALPDIQRPFVWTAVKARNLFDSMYRGFPIGYLLFWKTGAEPGARQIGVEGRETVPGLLIVDGQQRLTCLYSVLTATDVVDVNYRKFRIRLAFNPSTEEFAVSDAASDRDPEWFSDLSRLWFTDRNAQKRGFLDGVQASRPDGLPEATRDELDDALDRVERLESYPLRGVELHAAVDEEQVADIFVRINSEGVTLNQADFILTLMSVHWDKGRSELEDFARAAKLPAPDGSASPFNHIIKPGPDQLLRVGVAVAFRRAVLKYVYSLLRGKDLSTGLVTPERREEQFECLRSAQEDVLSTLYWHEYLKCLTSAGFITARMISSETAVLYGYALWLIGRRDFGLSVNALRGPLARWFFCAHSTGRFSSSPESRFESELAGLSTASDFVGHLDSQNAKVLTSDYWTITYPEAIATTASKSPALSAYFAALNVLGAEVLFSSQPVRALLDPAVVASKGVERHHLFPKAHLHRSEVADSRVNQIANLAFVEWFTNIAISDDDPKAYWPFQAEAMLRPGVGSEAEQAARQERYERQLRHHGLAPGWHEMDYETFLADRRSRIAQVVREGWGKLLDL